MKHHKLANDCWNLIRALSMEPDPDQPDAFDDAAIRLIEMACDSAVEAQQIMLSDTVAAHMREMAALERDNEALRAALDAALASPSTPRQELLAAACMALLKAKPQCECSTGSGCEMADARAFALAVLASPVPPTGLNMPMPTDEEQETDEQIEASVAEIYARRGGASPVPPGWQPIETAPKGSGFSVLVWEAGSRVVHIAQINNAGEAWTGDWDYHVETATHWMPLPMPPVSAEALSPPQVTRGQPEQQHDPHDGEDQDHQT